jgi:acetolactate synthase-1/2/3 large subunit
MLNSLKGGNMLVREAIMRFFENRDIEFLFHLPGIHTLSLDDTLNRSNIRVILGRHESNSGFMAEGFSEVTGKAGVLLVTPGPGIGNCVSPCMEAYGDDIPLLILFVDVKRNEMKRGLLHGVEAPESLFSGITKGTFAILRAEELLPALERAYALAVTPRQ